MIKKDTLKIRNSTQKIVVFQQNNKGESKVKGIEKYGKNKFKIDIVSISNQLPPVIDDSSEFLPESVEADIVLDFLTHPDLSHDLALMCEKADIPVVASGKKTTVNGTLTPPT